MDYKTMKRDDIIKYCVDNGQVAWLKETAATIIDDRRITFFEIKQRFCEKFMPEIMPKRKAAKPTMYDIIANL